MKRYLLIALVLWGCHRKINYIAAPNEFIIKKIEPFNGDYLYTDANGKRQLLSVKLQIGDTIHLFK